MTVYKVGIDYDFEPTLKSKRSRMREYSRLCERMLTLIALKDPCNLCTIKNNVECLGSQQNEVDSNVLCCDGCKHHSKKGCRVKSLSCLVWLCMPAWKGLHSKFPDEYAYFVQEREYVIQQMKLHDIPAHPRTSKTDNFK